MSQKSVVVAIVSSNIQILESYSRIFQGDSRITAVWTLADYPGPNQMSRLAEVDACVLFLDYTDSVKARAVAAELDRVYPTVVTVAIHARRSELDLFDLMRVGVREVVEEIEASVEAREVFERAHRKFSTEGGVEGAGAPLFAFLPARPGSGATTVAVHAATSATSLGNQRTLLIDFDLRLGLTSFLLKLNGERSVLDALSLSSRLEDTLWDSLVNRRGMLDILGSAPVDFSYEQHDAHAAQLLQFVRRKYQAVCVDLPGELRDHEVETLQQAQEVFLVCTPEIGTLHMARRKIEALRVLDLLPRVSVVVNRTNLKGGARMSIPQVEELLGVPVQVTLPEADGHIAKATREASTVPASSSFGKQIAKLSERIVVSAVPPEQQTPGRSFIDFFSVSQIREKTPWRQ